jgi:hypothetical protein
MRDGRRRELTPREMHRQRRQEQIQRRRLVAALILLGLIILIIVLVATCGRGDEGATTTTTDGTTTTTTLTAVTFAAELIGEDTEGTGEFLLAYDPDFEELSFELLLDGVDSPTTANLYEVAEDDGEPGSPLYSLYADTTEEGEYTGRLAAGIIDETDLQGSLADGTLADLIELIREGRVYVGVGTADTPIDALRGELVETTVDTGDDTDTIDDGTDTTDEDDTRHHGEHRRGVGVRAPNRGTRGRSE